MLRDCTYVLLLFTFCGGYIGSIVSPIDGQMGELNTTTDSNDYYNFVFNGLPSFFQSEVAPGIATAIIMGILSLVAGLLRDFCHRRCWKVSKLKVYTSDLKTLYKERTTSEWENIWPRLAIVQFLHLAMIMAEKVERVGFSKGIAREKVTGKVGVVLRNLKKDPVELRQIFDKIKEGKRKTVLLEGAPGCGKSTLSCHICSKWAEGRLFKKYKQVVLVKLREKDVQQAKSVAGILTSTSNSIGSDIEKELIACKGKGVLFVLDGWDELPKGSECHSIILKLLGRTTNLLESSIIITSRTTSSADLYNIVNSRVEILGFTEEVLEEYFNSCLDKKVDNVKALIQKIKENPAVGGSCYLPLNASILVYLCNEGLDLPKTQFGIFSSLIRNCIYRHEVKTKGADNASYIKSFDNLPEHLQCPFKELCKLAYDGVMDDEVIFEDLPSDFNTLGLLQGGKSLADGGMKCYHNFLHLSIQEFLAAIHMAKQLEPREQVDKFRELLGRARFSAVFQFYSAKTKLETPGIHDVVTEAIEICLHHPRVCELTPSRPEITDSESGGYALVPTLFESKIANDMESYSNTKLQPILLCLLHCLHEAQDKDLYQRVIKQFKTSELNLDGIGLNPADCLAVGSFLARTKQFKVTLEGCFIGADGCKTLFKVDAGETYDLQTLDLKFNFIEAEGGMTVAAAIKTATNLQKLSLSHDEIRVKGVMAVAAAIKTATNLQELNLQGNFIGDEGAMGLAAAMKTITNLQELNLRSNTIGDKGTKAVAAAMETATNLRKLE